MLRMRRITQILAAAAVAAITGYNTAQAGITLTFTLVPLGGNANANTLNNNGWIGVKIDAVADASTGAVGGFDLDTSTAGVRDNMGFHQLATLTDPGNTGVWTTVTPSTSGTLPTNNRGTDSLWSSFPGQDFAAAATLSEDSNHQSTIASAPFTAPNPPYSHSPLSEAVTLNTGSGPATGFAILGQGPGDNGDGSGPGAGGIYSVTNFGVGSFLKGAGAFKTDLGGQLQDQPLMYVVVPLGSVITVDGTFTDGAISSTPAALNDYRGANAVSFPVQIPEPASLGVLALGGLALFARRRKA